MNRTQDLICSFVTFACNIFRNFFVNQSIYIYTVTFIAVNTTLFILAVLLYPFSKSISFMSFIQIFLEQFLGSFRLIYWQTEFHWANFLGKKVKLLNSILVYMGTD